MSTWWRTHPVMAWPRGRILHISDNRVQVREADGSWNTIPDLTEPPPGAEQITDPDADQDAEPEDQR